MEHEIINHMDLEKGKCYDTAELYRQETRGEKTVLFTNTPTRYIGQYVGNSWDHTTGPIPPEKIYYFRDRDGRTNSLTRNFHDPWLYFREVPCPSLSLLDGNTNINHKGYALTASLNNPSYVGIHNSNLLIISSNSSIIQQLRAPIRDATITNSLPN
jgi:hypothetical protein